MRNVSRPAPFVLISSNHGSLIINRNDYRMIDQTQGYGLGFQIMHNSCYDQQEIDMALTLLDSRHANFGPGVCAIDCGANVGVHTVEWARSMSGWGYVYSFEAQEKIFYALAGNVIINNCLNVTARHAAVGSVCGTLSIAEPDYLVPSSYGSFELKKTENTEFIGQAIDYDNPQKLVNLVSIDSLNLNRLDFLKIDVEGMEVEVLEGAKESIEKFKPQILVETIKSDKKKITDELEKSGYKIYPAGLNVLAVHHADPMVKQITVKN